MHNFDDYGKTMKKQKFIISIFTLILCSCSLINNDINNENIKDNSNKSHELQITQYPLGIIGGIEPIMIDDMENLFDARIDSGADTSSIDAKNIKFFERDGKPWVKFEVINRETGEYKLFKKPIARNVKIKKLSSYDRRKVVLLDVKFGNLNLQREFTLTDRSKYEYQVLIGRNLINGIALIDVAKKETLK